MNPIDENTIKQCNDCASKGLKYSQTNGRAQVMISEDYMQEAHNGMTYMQQASMLAEMMAKGDFGADHMQGGKAFADPVVAGPNQFADSTSAMGTPQAGIETPQFPAVEEPSSIPNDAAQGGYALAKPFGADILGSGPPTGGGTKNFTLAETDAVDVRPAASTHQFKIADIDASAEFGLFSVPPPKPPFIGLRSPSPDAEEINEATNEPLHIECGSARQFVSHQTLAVVMGKLLEGTYRRDEKTLLTADEELALRRTIADFYEGQENAADTSEPYDSYNAKAEAESWNDEISSGRLPHGLASAIGKVLVNGGEPGKNAPGNPATRTDDTLWALYIRGLLEVGARIENRWSCTGDCGKHTTIPCEQGIDPVAMKITGVLRRTAVDIISQDRVSKDGTRANFYRSVKYVYRVETAVKYDVYFDLSCKCPEFKEH